MVVLVVVLDMDQLLLEAETLRLLRQVKVITAELA
jgi:hypothetical protein